MLLEATLEELALYFGGHLKRFNVPVDLGSAQGARRAVLSVLHQTVLDKLNQHNGYEPKNLVEPGGLIKSCKIEPRVRPDFSSPPPFAKSTAAGI